LPDEKKRGAILQARWIRIAAIFILGALSYATLDYFLRDPGLTKKANVITAGTEARIDHARDVVIPDSGNATPIRPLQQNMAQAPQQKPKQPTAAPSNEFDEMQNYYAMQIQLRRNEIVRFASDRPEIEQQINIEFASIDSVYNSMKNDLKDNMDKQEVIEAMILNYRVRLELLDVILQELKEKSATVTEKRKSYEI
jgi:pyruvate/2-oxoglutarate dehydrogenase complex dihydrolipoamide acyltransferase (E2) component